LGPRFESNSRLPPILGSSLQPFGFCPEIHFCPFMGGVILFLLFFLCFKSSPLRTPFQTFCLDPLLKNPWSPVFFLSFFLPFLGPFLSFNFRMTHSLEMYKLAYSPPWTSPHCGFSYQSFFPKKRTNSPTGTPQKVLPQLIYVNLCPPVFCLILLYQATTIFFFFKGNSCCFMAFSKKW